MCVCVGGGGGGGGGSASQINYLFLMIPTHSHFCQHWSGTKGQKENKPEKEKRSLQHLLFPGSHPSKYWAGPTLLNFSDLTRTGVFSVVWS